MFLSDTHKNKGTKFYKEVVRLLNDWPRVSEANLIKDDSVFKVQALGTNGCLYTLWFTEVTPYTANVNLTLAKDSDAVVAYPNNEWEILSGLMTPSLAADQILMFLTV